jgi:Tfp pilus assembly protein FimT
MRRPATTLLELTLVMTIVGVCLALVAPRFSAVRDTAAVRGASGEISATFSLARQTAIARRVMVAIVLDTASGSVQVRAQGQLIRSRPLGAIYGIAMGSNRDSAVYDARGLGYGAFNLTIVVRRRSAVDTLTASRLGRLRW